MSKLTPSQHGYYDGDRTGRYCSTVDVTTRFPEWDEDQVEQYMNARDDAVRGEEYGK